MMTHLTLQELSDYWYERANKTYEDDEEDFEYRYKFKEAWATHLFFEYMATKYFESACIELMHREGEILEQSFESPGSIKWS